MVPKDFYSFINQIRKTIQLKIIIFLLIFFNLDVTCGYTQTIKELLKKAPTSSFGAVALDLNSGKELFSVAPHRPLIPASVLKLLVSYAALKNLGSEYVLHTKFYITKGQKTDLYIKGGGDPSLTSESLRSIAEELKRRGLYRINNIILDRSLFEPLDRQGARAYEASAHPFSINYNSIRLWACRDPIGKIQVGADPKAYSPNVSSEISTGEESILDVGSFDGPKKTVQMTGTLAFDEKCVSVYRSVDNVSEYFSKLFQSSLKEADIQMSGKVKEGEIPDNVTEIYSHPSKPLPEIVSGLNHFSTNMIADTLLYHLGRSDLCCKREEGLKILEETLKEIDVPKEDFHIDDASGLSRSNQISAHGVLQILRRGVLDPDIAPEFLSSLSILGRTGTLKNRFTGEPPFLFRGKTGSLNGVSSIAGEMYTKKGKRVLVVLIENEVSDKELSASWEESVLQALYKQE